MRNITIDVFVKNIFFIDYNRSIDGTMWYMSLLIIWYLLFYFIFKLKTVEEIKIIFMFMFGFLIVDIQDIFIGCAWQFAQNALSFPIGILLGYISTYINFKLSNKIKVLFFTVLTGVYVISFKNFNFQFLGILLTGILTITVKLLNEIGEGILLDKLKLLGDKSYRLYLLEGKLMILFSFFVSKKIALFFYIILLGIGVFLLEFIEKEIFYEKKGRKERDYKRV